VCNLAGISEQTYYNWRNRGLAESGRVASNPRFSVRQDEQIYVEFFEATTHAQAEARQAAVGSIRQAYNLSGIKTRNVTTKTTTETRLRKKRNPDGSVEEIPYAQTRTETTETITHYPADWRAAVEFLKRRDSANWSDKVTITLEDMRNQAVADIRAGKLSYEALAAEDKSLADELFTSAGVPIEAGTGQTTQRPD
jgi:hypothetical protein